VIKFQIVLVLCLTILIYSCADDNDDPVNSEISPVISVKFTLKNLPELLPVNMPNTGDNSVEYSWNVLFDMDDNNVRSTGDLVFGLRHIKWPDSQPNQSKISDFDVVLSEHTSDTSTMVLTNGSVEVVANTILIKIAIASSPVLKNIDSTIKVQFSSIGHDSNGQIYGDAYPVDNSVATFISILPNGLFVDDPSDISELVGVDVRYIDLQTMEIIIEQN